MKSDKKIFAAFLLNLLFSLWEFAGGALTGSVAILSDAIHDLGDSVSIGASYVLERISKHPADRTHPYGYLRYSVLGSLVTTLVLLTGSLLVIARAVERLIHPVPIHHEGMILVALFGTLVNLIAAWFTHEGCSMNQRAVNLHMLEDVLGWVVVLVGAVLIRLTGFVWLDPLLSLGVALFILIHACNHLMHILVPFLEKTPEGMDTAALEAQLLRLPGVTHVHSLAVRTLDGYQHAATVHIQSAGDPRFIRQSVKDTLVQYGITHATVELEQPGETCCTARPHTHPIPCEHHRHHHHH